MFPDISARSRILQEWQEDIHGDRCFEYFPDVIGRSSLVGVARKLAHSDIAHDFVVVLGGHDVVAARS
jgi:hypothetical protein